MPAGYQPVVVDNGSAGGSGALAARLGAAVITEPSRGFGAACWAGLRGAGGPAGVVCLMDGDGFFVPGGLPRVAGPVLRGEADVVMGGGLPTERGAVPPHVPAPAALTACGGRQRRGCARRHPPGRRRMRCRREDRGPRRSPGTVASRGISGGPAVRRWVRGSAGPCVAGNERPQ